ncbi:MAG: hypothetical protein EA412_01725 [Chitinophagaceae bacterium]|nr:MAG: hypothetical protein EA412_01725 [Chitinophagaceae bacterium]
MKNKAYLPSEVDFKIEDIANRNEPLNVLMCTPDHFDIIDVKNVHMEGQAGNLDKEKAKSQWNSQKEIYQTLKTRGVINDYWEIKGQMDCEDMVFCANQTFPWINNKNEKLVILSKMRHPSRQKEVAYFKEFFENKGYQTIDLKKSEMFEGMGDAIPHYGKNLIYGGFGHRTKKETYDEIAETLDVTIVCLELIDSRFYHLDTCFIPLDEESVILCPEAFTLEGLKVIEKLFSNVIRIPSTEASGLFSLNAHTINNQKNGKKAAIIQYGSIFTYNALEKSGFEVFEIDTAEFMKSGGSVFCMKMMTY